METSYPQDLIAAIATPRGSGGVGIIRCSGSDAAISAMAKSLTGKELTDRHATYTPFHGPDKEIVDQGIALYFKGPHSYTGESVLELQAHGGSVVLDSLLQTVATKGARLAEPGEFSMRAYLNGKMDLLQAEAVCDLINAGSKQAARSAIRSMQGAFSTYVTDLQAKLVSLRTYVEASIDFSDEEIDFLAEGEVLESLQAQRLTLQSVMDSAQQGALLREGVSLALVGRPNVGKSSLLNRLTQTNTAIVTDIAGTTRDTLREAIEIDGLPIHLVDTAGLRETDDPVEKIGVERTWQAIEASDCILLVFDVSSSDFSDTEALYLELKQRLESPIPILAVGNKTDQGVNKSVYKLGFSGGLSLVSATENDGVDKLKASFKASVGFQSRQESPVMARRRHLVALNRVSNSLDQAILRAKQKLGDCVAEELRYAQDALSELTGSMTSDDLLGEIFSQFCVGK